MPFVSTVGGNIDVDPTLIGQNINAAPLFGTPQDFGNNTDPGEMHHVLPRVHPSQRDNPLAMGAWQHFDDDSVVCEANTITPDIYTWSLPNGTSIALDSSEIRGDAWWFHVTNSYHLKNLYIKLTANTLPGFVAFGMVSTDTGRGIIDNQPPTPPGVLDTIGDIAGKATKPITATATAIAAVALVVVAIWFLPKDILRKGAA